MNKLLVSIVFLLTKLCYAQIPENTLYNGVQISTQLLDEIILTNLNLSSDEYWAFKQIEKKVHKVYPYAIKSKKQLHEIEDDLNYTDSKREKRKISKLHSSWLQNHFSKDLKKLTRSEGRILIKLIYYETEMSCYDLIKKYRKGVNAILWQGIAKLYDGDLKAILQPKINKEDLWIEYIVKEINHQ